MPTENPSPQSLDQWLDFISKVHPKEIDLGLDRVAAVAQTLEITNPAPQVVSIAGTNGKGSTVAALETLLLKEGKRVGAFTSPHLHHFNERIRLNGSDIDNDRLCAAFSKIEANRGEHSLSYFEFATLAALLIFTDEALDVALLEVGLGGRLDAVNLVDADIAVITSISLDHEEWLGNDLEVIGFEKAGIARTGAPLIFADPDMPISIKERASALQAPLYQIGKEFTAQLGVNSETWAWSGKTIDGDEASYLDLPLPQLHLNSVAAAIQVLHLINYPPSIKLLATSIQDMNLAGRFESRLDTKSNHRIVLDVAHNPAAAKELARRLIAFRKASPSTKRIIGVLAVLNDKDIEGIVVSLQSVVDIWYIAQIDDPRMLSLEDAMRRVSRACPSDSFRAGFSVSETYTQACASSEPNDLIVILGSFHTVAIARKLSRAH